MKCTIDGLADAITKELSEYSQDVTDKLKVEVKQVAKECKKDIQTNSPISSGDYKKGWSVKNNYEGREDIRVTICNKTNYQLTHLLEHGHVNRDGTSRSNAIPHIAPAEKTAAEKLLQRVKVIVK